MEEKIDTIIYDDRKMRLFYDYADDYKKEMMFLAEIKRTLDYFDDKKPLEQVRDIFFSLSGWYRTVDLQHLSRFYRECCEYLQENMDNKIEFI